MRAVTSDPRKLARWVGMSKTKTCTNCGTVFTYTRNRQTTCSRSCGNQEAWSRRTSSAPATAATDSEASATPSYPPAQKRRSASSGTTRLEAGHE